MRNRFAFCRAEALRRRISQKRPSLLKIIALWMRRSRHFAGPRSLKIVSKWTVFSVFLDSISLRDKELLLKHYRKFFRYFEMRYKRSDEKDGMVSPARRPGGARSIVSARHLPLLVPRWREGEGRGEVVLRVQGAKRNPNPFGIPLTLRVHGE